MKDVGKRVVVVAVKASRDISRSAFIWALTHVVQPGDSVKLLVLIPNHTSSKFFFCPNILLRAFSFYVSFYFLQFLQKKFAIIDCLI